MKKRYRTPKAKEGELLVKYGNDGGDIDLFYCYQGDATMKRDSKLLSYAFESIDILGDGCLRKELENRGYDITTLKFSIMKKQSSNS